MPSFWLKSAPERATRRGNPDRGPDPREVFSGRHLFTSPNGQMAFLDAAGACLIPVQHDPPINPMLDDQTTMGVHHAFAIAHDDYQAALDHLRARRVEITFRMTGKVAYSTARAPISTIPMAPCWSLLI